MTDPAATPDEPKSPVYMLIEAKFNALDCAEEQEQFMGFTDYANSLFIEEFGQPLAWRVDSHFSFLLRTDQDRLLQFISASFMADNLSINNDLQLLRVECELLPV